jgi:cytochrome c553
MRESQAWWFFTNRPIAKVLSSKNIANVAGYYAGLDTPFASMPTSAPARVLDRTA